MQEGILLFRDGKMDEAYKVFQQLTVREPANEFAWIWISLTSSDAFEKSSALLKALKINPDSNHAKEALKDLDFRQKSALVNAKATKKATQIPIPPLPAETSLSGFFDLEEKPLEEDTIAPINNSNKLKGKKLHADIVSTTPGQFSAKKKVRRSTFAVRLFGFLLFLVIGSTILIYIYLTQTGQDWNPFAVNPVLNSDPETEKITPGVLITSTSGIVISGNPLTSIPRSSTSAITSTESVITIPAQAGSTGSKAEQVNKLLDEARRNSMGGDYKSAIETTKKALALDPKSPIVNFELGLNYLTASDGQVGIGINRFEEASKAFLIVTEQAPTWSGGWAWLGQAQAGNGNLLLAIKAYNKSLELDPVGVERWLALANLYDRNNQPAEATYARQRAQGKIISPSLEAPR